jgi:UDP-N-acetylmuramate--alanine ligase
MKHIHLIGIGGTGLSAIARVLLEKGYTVSGSDRSALPLFNAITAAGARTFLGHAAEQIAGADLVVRSSAIPDDNPEVVAARSQGIPVLKRSEFLEELTGDKDTLAVAGSHGKTTTTAMLVWMLDRLGTEPSFILGGVIRQLGCNARAGAGLYFAIEADEYDYMFLGLSPKIAIITNIEHDHPDCFPTQAEYQQAFKAFLERVRPDGLALICQDDPQARVLMNEMKEIPAQVLGYGTSTQAVYLAENIQIIKGYPQFELFYQPNLSRIKKLGEVQLSVPGRHNVLNATAALAAIHALGLSEQEAINAVKSFTGADRRFEVIGEVGGVTVIDDYGHHPTQLASTLEAARELYPKQRLWAVWEPHTYSRTQAMEDEFTQALDLADKVIVLKIYAARENNPVYTAKRIADALTEKKASYIPNFDSAADFLLENLSPGDVVITFSAGKATQVSQDVLAGLQQQRQR